MGFQVSGQPGAWSIFIPSATISLPIINDFPPLYYLVLVQDILYLLVFWENTSKVQDAQISCTNFDFSCTIHVLACTLLVLYMYFACIYLVPVHHVMYQYKISCTSTWLSCSSTWLSCTCTWYLVLVHDLLVPVHDCLVPVHDSLVPVHDFLVLILYQHVTTMY